MQRVKSQKVYELPKVDIEFGYYNFLLSCTDEKDVSVPFLIYSIVEQVGDAIIIIIIEYLFLNNK